MSAVPGPDLAAAPFAVACLLLVAAGLPKVAAPDDLRRALATAGLRVPGGVVRAVGAGEAALGVAGLLVGGAVLTPVLGAAVAASYLVFTAFVVAALRRGWALSSCGCFGRADTPPTASHAVVTGALSVGAALWAASSSDVGALPVGLDSPAAGLAFAGLVALGTWLTWAALTLLPRLHALSSSRPTSGTSAEPARFRLLEPAA